MNNWTFSPHETPTLNRRPASECASVGANGYWIEYDPDRPWFNVWFSECQHCKKIFKTKRCDTLYCSRKCRDAARDLRFKEKNGVWRSTVRRRKI